MNHWIAFVEGFALAPQEFYMSVEQELVTRKIPGLKVSRVEYTEGGLLSDQRIYLRMIRERLAFDTCAAPFGTGYFFSCRTIYSPVVVRLWHILAVLFVLSALYSLLWEPLGPAFASIAVVSLVIALGQMFQKTVALGLADLDALLLKTPVISPIYERWFRLDTYYRQDTRLMYLETVPKLVRELAEHLTAAKGLRLVPQYQRGPVLGKLYKRVKPPPQDAQPK